MKDRLLAGLVRLFGFLPFAWAGRLGAFFGRVLYRFDGREVRNARVNLALCFPAMSETERERVVERNLAETGRTLAEMLRIWVGPRLDLTTLVDESGFIEAGRALLARGHGVIFALPHLGNWELIGDSIMHITPVTALYRPPRLSFMDPIMRAGRARTGVEPVPIDRQGLKELHAALQRGEGVVILPDQVPKSLGASGVLAPFFGHPAMTMTLISRLARKHRSPVMFCFAVYDPAIGRHRIHHFEGEAAIAAASPEAAAAALNRGVERCVRRFPASYQWTYRRFQIPGSREPNPYRGGRRPPRHSR
jgi:KDO2-lipid IV(A) lauroyltransferase